MKVSVSFRIEEDLYAVVKNKPNMSRYLESLVRQDVHMQLETPIVTAVKEELLQNETFIAEIARRLGTSRLSTTTPHASQTTQSPLPEKQEPEKKPPRNMGTILKEIDSFKEEVTERLEYCQDAGTRDKIIQESQDTIDALWAEYNELKEDN